MPLPENLQEAIEIEIDRFGWHTINEARKELTDRYRSRSHDKQAFMTKEEHRCAYIAARMPATYSVIYRVLEEIKSRSPSIIIKSLLDLGSGPGTAMWAAHAVFEGIDTITQYEQDEQLISLGRRLANHSDQASLKNARWELQNLEHITTLPQHDLITLSYSIGELPDNKILPLIDKCWDATQQFLVIIEPGTPIGFERIRTIRQHLIERRAWMVAPCPHSHACPMKDGDWCHFSERVERSSIHRRLKEGTLGYEDEKYSYIAVSKFPSDLPQSRVLRHPIKRSGHVNITLCTPEGIKQETFSKRNKEIYKEARKIEWGSAFSPDKQ